MRPNLGGFVNPNRTFSESYRCFPIAMMQNGSERENVNYGGKSKRTRHFVFLVKLECLPLFELVILPQSALEKLCKLSIRHLFGTGYLHYIVANLNISYPMLFKLVHGAGKKHSHAGVLEFIAEEGRVYLPQWVRG